MSHLELDTHDTFDVEGTRYRYHSIPAVARSARSLGELERLPNSLKILLEGILRHGHEVEDIDTLLQRLARGERGMEIPFWPGRVLLQDVLGTTALVDIATLRDAVAAAGGDPRAINLKVPVDLVVDHSLVAHHARVADAMERNMKLEFALNRERFEFIAWCQHAMKNLRVVPPGNGIMHQVNLEYLASVVTVHGTGSVRVAYPDTVIGTDSHTTMINGLGVLGWGVGGIEGEAVMLGRALSLSVPEVIGIELRGTLPRGVLATDLVLTITELMRRKDVVGKFVEFFGPGLEGLSLADRATIANMAPEFGATCVYFPIDTRTTHYLDLTGRTPHHVRLVEAYARAQGCWREHDTAPPAFDLFMVVDLNRIERSIAGPRRPEERVPLSQAKNNFERELPVLRRTHSKALRDKRSREAPSSSPSNGSPPVVRDGDVVIAAITSCTNTSNPSAMIAAGLLAKKAAARGLKSKPWVKTTLAPGSKVVMAYLQRAGLDDPLAQLGFRLAGFGCTTCSGMSGPLADQIEEAIRDEELTCVAVLSGNRNFEGRIHRLARAAYLASPPLVVAYALTGTFKLDITRDPLGCDPSGAPVRLDDIWPSDAEIAEVFETAVTRDLFVESNSTMLRGNEHWRSLRTDPSELFSWRPESAYLRRAPYFDGLSAKAPSPGPLKGLRPLAILGHSINTDHLSPSGAIPPESAAGRYLLERCIVASDFNSYSTRRGNHEVGMRATLASLRLQNAMVNGLEGSLTQVQPEGTVMPIFDAAMVYRARGTRLIIVAGRNYGCGSSRDWAAKGVALVGVKVVVAESFERIHRSNLIGMGVLPLEFAGTSAAELALDGRETFDVIGLDIGLSPRRMLELHITRASGERQRVDVVARLDTNEEVACYAQGGILPLVYRESLSDINVFSRHQEKEGNHEQGTGNA